MGQTLSEAKFRGLVQLSTDELLVDRASWSSSLDSLDPIPSDVFSKLTPEDVLGMFQCGNLWFVLAHVLFNPDPSLLHIRMAARLLPTAVARKERWTEMSEAFALETDREEALDGSAISAKIACAVMSFCKQEWLCVEDGKPWSFVLDGGEGGDSGRLDGNRIEVLRLLVLAASEPLFVKGAGTSGSVQEEMRRTREEGDFQYEVPTPEYVLTSLLGVVIENEYPTSFFSASKKANLADHCVDALVVLLDSDPPNELNVAPNIFIQALKSSPIYNKPEARSKIVGAIAKRIVREKATSIPTLVLCWRVIEAFDSPTGNVNEADVCTMVAALCFALWTGRKTREAQGIVQMSSIIMLVLSADRKCATGLNRTFADTPEVYALIPKHFPVVSGEWTFVDVVIATFCKFIVDGDSNLYEPLQNLSLTTYMNISPYTRSIMPISASTLVSVFEKCSRPKFLFAANKRPAYAHALLESFTNTIQYSQQSQASVNLLYAMMRSKQSFARLHALEFSSIKLVNKMGEEVGNEVIPNNEKQPEETAAFMPTEAWFNEWKQRLPLNVCLLAIKELSPVVDKVLLSTSDEAVLLQALSETSLIGVLPRPHPLIIARYARSRMIDSIIRRTFWTDLLLQSRKDGRKYHDLLEVVGKT